MVLDDEVVMIEFGDTHEVSFKAMSGKRTIEANIDPGAARTTLDYLKASKIGAGPLVKTVKTKQASGEERRPVAKMWVEIEEFEELLHVGLSDREGMSTKAIIGKDILSRDKFTVNV